MAKHPQHDLLIAAANDKDAKFIYQENFTQHGIYSVLTHPKYDWKLVDKFAELKKAEQEGKKIEWLCKSGEWLPKHTSASWEIDGKYRIKSEPIYEWQWLVKRSDGTCDVTNYYVNKPVTGSINTILYRIEESKREVKS